MNQFKKIYASLRRNRKTGVIEAHVGKPHYFWSTTHLYYSDNVKYLPIQVKHLFKNRSYYRPDIYEYFTTRLNSRKCPIDITLPNSEMRNPYGRLLEFTEKPFVFSNNIED